MRNPLTFLIYLALGLVFSFPAYAVEAHVPAAVSSEAPQHWEKSVKIQKKGGVPNRFLAMKALKKGLLKGHKWIQDRAGKLSQSALYIFIGALILLTIGAFISVALVYAGLFALVTSNILSIFIMATEEDKKAKRIAKVILWTTLALVVVSLLLLLVTYLLLAAFFAAIFG